MSRFWVDLCFLAGESVSSVTRTADLLCSLYERLRRPAKRSQPQDQGGLHHATAVEPAEALEKQAGAMWAKLLPLVVADDDPLVAAAVQLSRVFGLCTLSRSLSRGRGEEAAAGAVVPLVHLAPVSARAMSVLIAPLTAAGARNLAEGVRLFDALLLPWACRSLEQGRADTGGFVWQLCGQLFAEEDEASRLLHLCLPSPHRSQWCRLLAVVGNASPTPWGELLRLLQAVSPTTELQCALLDRLAVDASRASIAPERSPSAAAVALYLMERPSLLSSESWVDLLSHASAALDGVLTSVRANPSSLRAAIALATPLLRHSAAAPPGGESHARALSRLLCALLGVCCSHRLSLWHNRRELIDTHALGEGEEARAWEAVEDAPGDAEEAELRADSSQPLEAEAMAEAMAEAEAIAEATAEGEREAGRRGEAWGSEGMEGVEGGEGGERGGEGDGSEGGVGGEEDEGDVCVGLAEAATGLWQLAAPLVHATLARHPGVLGEMCSSMRQSVGALAPAGCAHASGWRGVSQRWAWGVLQLLDQQRQAGEGEASHAWLHATLGPAAWRAAWQAWPRDCTPAWRLCALALALLRRRSLVFFFEPTCEGLALPQVTNGVEAGLIIDNLHQAAARCPLSDS